MTTIVVLADPPVPECAPSVLPDSFDAETQLELYRAMLADVCATIQHGEAELLVNYPREDAVPDDVDAEKSLRELLAGELEEPDEVRYEVQVGETYDGRVGNALTHLLETEEQPTAGIVEPTAIFLRREHIGTTAMQLRTNDVVLGPAPGGKVAFAAFREPIDFSEAYATPAIETMTERAMDADLDVSFLPMTPLFESAADIETAVSLLRARIRAGAIVPNRTAQLVTELDLSADSLPGRTEEE